MTSSYIADSTNVALRDSSVEHLAERARTEVARYKRGEGSDDSFCLELMRRAIAERDDAAWHALQGVFHDQVLSWCRSAVHGSSVDPEEIACVTWEKFWLFFTPEKLAAASNSAGALRYLKMCSRSAALDALRSRISSISLDESPVDHPGADPAPAEANAHRDVQTRFWSIINASLRDERERVILYFTYELGLKSAQIQAKRPDLFPSVADVYRVTRNVLDRLKRNRALQAWYAQDLVG
jgi:hypothetical protein